RDAGDAVAIRGQFGEGKKVAVIGGGWVGLEVAAAAKLNGCDVTVILNSDAPPLSSVLGEELGQHFEDLHQKNGVTFLKEANTTSFTGSTAVEAVETSAGSVPADLVVIGIGADPTVDTAASAGLSTDNGVVVDEHMRTSDGSILAIGDIATPRTLCAMSVCASSTGTTPSDRPKSRRRRSPAARRPTTGSRTSTPISSTSVWNTSATAAPPTRSSSGAISPAANSSCSGRETVGSPRP